MSLGWLEYCAECASDIYPHANACSRSERRLETEIAELMTKNEQLLKTLTEAQERGTWLVLRNRLLSDVVTAYNEAADKFIAKVQDGRARSRETYRDLVRAREQSKEII